MNKYKIIYTSGQETKVIKDRLIDNIDLLRKYGMVK